MVVLVADPVEEKQFRVQQAGWPTSLGLIIILEHLARSQRCRELRAQPITTHAAAVLQGLRASYL